MPLQVDYAAKKTIQIAITKYFPIWGEGQTLPVCLAVEAEWREKMKVLPQLSEKMLASAQWVGIPGKNGPQWHNDLGRKTLKELLNTVAEEKQLEDSGCDRINRT